MPTSYTDLLRLALQATGENDLTWGAVLNSNVFEMIEEAIAGALVLDVSSGNVTLSVNDGVTDQARKAILEFNGAPSNDVTITVPTTPKSYWVKNDLSVAKNIIITTGSGLTASVPQGSTASLVVTTDGVESNVPTDVLRKSGNLAGLADLAVSRTNLGLGALATLGPGAGLTVNGSNVDVSVAAFSPGDVMASFATSKSGWVLASGGTIGNASSNATLRANADTETLFTLLWNNLDQTNYPLQDSSGAVVARGANAAADFAANRRFPVPDLRDRTVVGKGDMGGTAANRISAFISTVLGAFGGSGTHTLSIAEMPSHDHGLVQSLRGLGPWQIQFSPGTSMYSTNTDPTGGGQAHNNVQPSIAANYFIKL